MGRTYAELEPDDQRFIEAQKLFFVATAPLSAEGHVNLSPKGLDTFRVLAPNRVAYLDFTGSGVETIAHLRDNGRITLMFCAFTGSPKILRLYGAGRLHRPDTEGFDALAPKFGDHGLVRGVIEVDVHRVSTACGYGVPRMSFEGDRDQLARWVDKKGPEGVAKYQREKNRRSIDGLDGLIDV